MKKYSDRNSMRVQGQQEKRNKLESTQTNKESKFDDISGVYTIDGQT